MITQYQPCGDKMLLVEFAREISPETHAAVHRLALLLEQANIEGVTEWLPSYCSLGVIYDPLKLSYAALVEQLRQLQAVSAEGSSERVSRRVEIPVAYGGELGPDLAFVAEYHGLSCDEVIALHTNAVYRVYLIGFTPGFPYLGGLPREMHTPRLDNPRVRVPAGSVAIGGQQAGIYPVDSPGGWRILGRTPVRLFDLHRSSPCLVQMGDIVEFRAISHDEFSSQSARMRH
jgi:inhibitor of KinA